MPTATKAFYQYLVDNPGWHFTEDIVEAVLAKYPRMKRATLTITPHNLLVSRKMRIEMGGSKLTRKWRVAQ